MPGAGQGGGDGLEAPSSKKARHEDLPEAPEAVPSAESRPGVAPAAAAAAPVADEGRSEGVDTPLRSVEKKRLDFSGKLYLAPLTTVGNLPFRSVLCMPPAIYDVSKNFKKVSIYTELICLLHAPRRLHMLLVWPHAHLRLCLPRSLVCHAEMVHAVATAPLPPFHHTCLSQSKSQAATNQRCWAIPWAIDGAQDTCLACHQLWSFQACCTRAS